MGDSLAEIIGLPGGGILPLWNFGSRYICAVRGEVFLRYAAVLGCISLAVSMVSTVSCTIELWYAVRSVGCSA